MERTLVICKPDAVERGLVGEVVGRIERRGLRLVAAELRTDHAEVAEVHYAEHQGKPFFDGLVAFITRSPVMVLVVEGPDGVHQVIRTMMGATDPAEAAPGHHPGRSGHRDGRERHPRLGFAGIGRTGDRDLLPRPGLTAGGPDPGRPCAHPPIPVP